MLLTEKVEGIGLCYYKHQEEHYGHVMGEQIPGMCGSLIEIVFRQSYVIKTDSHYIKETGKDTETDRQYVVSVCPAFVHSAEKSSNKKE